ncbi:hypothetical protein Tco_1395684 [Tanacetum coccineum]
MNASRTTRPSRTTIPHHGGTTNVKKKKDGPEWIVRSKFEDELANFMLENKSHTKGIRELLDQHCKELHEQFSQILSTIRKSETSKPEAPTFAITTRSGVSTQDPPFPAPSQSTSTNHTKGETEKERPEGAEPTTIQEHAFGHPSFTNPPNSHQSVVPRSHDPHAKGSQGVCPKKKGTQEASHCHVLSDPWQGTHETDECEQNNPVEQVCLSKGDSYDDPSLLRSSHPHYPPPKKPGFLRTKPVEPLEWKAAKNQLKPSCVKPPKLELKELPEHLEYAFLQENNQLPVVISSALSTTKKARLLEVLKNNKWAIAWSIADIKGIDSSFCTHKILMEDEFKPSVQPQRRVNPNIKEVVPKKVGMAIVKNEKDELILQRTVTGWRVCIDYRKLNNATPKDHFPLPFIDQMLKCLAGHEYYCFLDGFSGYFQIPIALEDQEKTTFTYPYENFAYK